MKRRHVDEIMYGVSMRLRLICVEIPIASIKPDHLPAGWKKRVVKFERS